MEEAVAYHRTSLAETTVFRYKMSNAEDQPLQPSSPTESLLVAVGLTSP